MLQNNIKRLSAFAPRSLSGELVSDAAIFSWDFFSSESIHVKKKAGEGCTGNTLGQAKSNMRQSKGAGEDPKGGSL